MSEGGREREITLYIYNIVYSALFNIAVRDLSLHSPVCARYMNITSHSAFGIISGKFSNVVSTDTVA